MTATYQKYDFRSPASRSSGPAARFSDWFEQLDSLIKERWQAAAGKELQIKYRSEQTLGFVELKAEIEPSIEAFHVTFGDPRIQSFFYAPRDGLLNLVNGVLATDLDESGERDSESTANASESMAESANPSSGDEHDEHDEHELTPIEHDLVALLFQELTDSMGLSWPRQEPMRFELGEPENQLHRSRLFDPKTRIIRIQFELIQGSIRCPLFWLVPAAELETLAEPDEPESATVSDAAPLTTAIENNIKGASIRISVLLGKSQVRLSDLANITKGDVILLDQKVTDPLCVNIQDEPVFLAWPGKRGEMQSIQIAELIQNP